MSIRSPSPAETARVCAAQGADVITQKPFTEGKKDFSSFLDSQKGFLYWDNKQKSKEEQEDSI